MIRWNDFYRPDKTHDWKGYKEACVAAGQDCQECGAYIGYEEPPLPRSCAACKELHTNKQTTRHCTFVRCPHCSAHGHPPKRDRARSNTGKRGYHTIRCSKCSKLFCFETFVATSYLSRALFESTPEVLSTSPALEQPAE